MISRFSSLKTILLLAALMLVLAACSEPATTPDTKGATQTNSASNSDNAMNDDTQTEETKTEDSQVTNESEGEDASVVYPIIIEHALGTTTIEQKPERIVTVQWGNQDVVLALGVEPVGFSAANFGVQDDSGLLPWTKQQIEKLGFTNPNVFHDTDGLDFEAISDANPDVILAAYSGLTQEDYNLLSEIAPVVAYPTAAWATPWREHVQYTAMGMGLASEGEQLIKDTEDLIKEKLSAYPQIEGKKVVWVNFSTNDLSKLHIYAPIDSRVAFLHELGMVYPEAVTDLISDPTKYSLNLSAENAEVLYEADLIVGYGNDELFEVLKNDELIGKIPAIANGAVAFIDASTPLVAAGTPNPLSIAYTIDDYLALIGAAAEKVNE